MSYTHRLTTSLGPGQAYIYSAHDPGMLPPTTYIVQGTVCGCVCMYVNSTLMMKVQGKKADLQYFSSRHLSPDVQTPEVLIKELPSPLL